jgi:hypothetical protein
LADLRKQLMDARRETQRKEDEQERLADLDGLERERIASHPLYDESIALVERAMAFAVKERSQRAVFRSGAVRATEASMREALRKIWLRVQKSKAGRDKYMEEQMAAVRVQAAWRKRQGTYAAFVIQRAVSQIAKEEMEEIEAAGGSAMVPLLRIGEELAVPDGGGGAADPLSVWESDLVARAMDDGSTTLRSLDSRDAVSLGSVADGMDDADRAAFSCLEYDLLVMETGQMLRMGLFQEEMDAEFESMEAMLQEELMEDEEYRNWDLGKRQSPREVLRGLLNER